MASLYLNRIPTGSTEIVDLKDEVVLCSIQPLHSNTIICDPGNTGQVVLTEGKGKPENHDTLLWNLFFISLYRS